MYVYVYIMVGIKPESSTPGGTGRGWGLSGGRAPPKGYGTPATHPFHLPQSIHQRVLESQLPHRIAHSIFEVIIVNNKLTILWKS